MSQSIEQVIVALDAESARAQKEHDLDALSAILDDKLVYTGADGALRDKNRFLNEAKSGRVLDTYQLESSVVHCYGEAAVVSGRAYIDGKVFGNTFSGYFRYTKMFVRKNDDWRIVGWHVTGSEHRPAAQAR